MNGEIEWTDRTWNPTRGCALVSPGCTNCYAMKFAHRFSGEGGRYEGLTRLRSKGGPVWTGRVAFVPEMLAAPLGWKKPQRVFVNSMSDLFHEDVTDEQIAAVFGVMAATPRHTYQILTKRPERMAAWMNSGSMPDICQSTCNALDSVGFERGCGSAFDPSDWPLRNVWLGVSVEDQQRADERIPHLLRVPAAVRFLSVEPMLGAVNLSAWLPQFVVSGASALSQKSIRALHDIARAGYRKMGLGSGPLLGWVIVGGESGPNARPFDLAWARDIAAECAAAGVPYFFKQAGREPRWRGDRIRRLDDLKGSNLDALLAALEQPRLAPILRREWPAAD